MVGLVDKIKPKVVTHRKNMVMPNTVFSKYGKELTVLQNVPVIKRKRLIDEVI